MRVAHPEDEFDFQCVSIKRGARVQWKAETYQTEKVDDTAGWYAGILGVLFVAGGHGEAESVFEVWGVEDFGGEGWAEFEDVWAVAA